MQTRTGREIGWRDEDGSVRVHPEPVRGRVHFGQLQTADNHALDIEFACSVRALDQSVERQMFAEVFLHSTGHATVDEVLKHFADTIRESATREVSSNSAHHWLSDAGRSRLVDCIKDAARPVAFSCGVELIAPFSIVVQSPTVEREKIETMHRKLAERRTAGQLEALARAGELLRQFEALRESAPELSAGAVLQRLSPADQGAMLQTLLLAGAENEGAELWAVAGPNLVKIDTRGQIGSAQVMPLPTVLGPLRSVQGVRTSDGAKLLIGARGGLLLVDPEGHSEPEIFGGAPVESQLGFNAAAYDSHTDIFYGTHGEAGLVAWRRGQWDAPLWSIAPAQLEATDGGPRNLRIVGDNVVFSVASRVCILEGERAVAMEPLSNAEVAGIVPMNGRAMVVHADGILADWDIPARKFVGRKLHAGPVTSTGKLPWMGEARLLLAGEGPAIDCIGAEDTLVSRYLSPHHGLRAVAAAGHAIAGVSADRQRVAIWHTWDGNKPAAEVYVGAIARHRVADIEFV